MNRIGIYLTDKNLRLIYISENQNSGTVPVEECWAISVQDKKNITSRLRMFFQAHGLCDEPVSVAVPCAKVKVRFLTVPSSDSVEIERMVKYDLGALFPSKFEELLSDICVIETKDNGYSRVMVTAILQESAEEKLSFLDDAVTPAALTVSTMALYNQLYFQVMETKTTYLAVHLEDSALDLLVLKGKKCIFTRGLFLNGEDDPAQIIKEVNMTITALSIRGINISSILLCGRTMGTEQNAAIFRDSCGCEVELYEGVSVLHGLVRDTGGNFPEINLLPKKYRQKGIKRKKKKVFISFVILLLLNVSLVSNIGVLNIKQKQAYLNFLRAEIKKIEEPVSFMRKKMLKVNLINQYFVAGRGSLKVVAELYRVTPVGIVFTSLDMEGFPGVGTLTVMGQAATSEEALRFAALLRSSPVFSGSKVKHITTSEDMVEFELKTGY